jgi:hypothetical protein
MISHPTESRLGQEPPRAACMFQNQSPQQSGGESRRPLDIAKRLESTTYVLLDISNNPSSESRRHTLSIEWYNVSAVVDTRKSGPTSCTAIDTLRGLKTAVNAAY